MAYTELVFDPTTPAGPSQLSAGDDAIRAFKLAIKERLETLVNSIDGNPLVLKTAITGVIGAKAGKRMLVSHSSFVNSSYGESPIYGSYYVQSDNNGLKTFYASLILPNLVDIRQIEVLWDKGGNGGIQLDLLSMAFNTSLVQGVVSEFTINNTAAGAQLSVSSVTVNAVSNNELLVIRIKATTPAAGQPIFIYGVKVIYDATDATETL